MKILLPEAASKPEDRKGLFNEAEIGVKLAHQNVIRIFKVNRQPNHIVANYSTLREDLYVIYEGNNPDTSHPIIKAFVNPLVAWVWIGVIVIIFGTGLALVPNAQQMRSPVQVTVAVPALDPKGMTTAGASK